MAHHNLTPISSHWSGPVCPPPAPDDSFVYAELGALLNTLNCLPGSGRIRVVANSFQSTAHDLPFSMNFVPLAVRKDLLQALASGGGCEIRLRIPETSSDLVLSVCFQSGKWQGCSAENVTGKFALASGEMAVSFPAAGTVEHFHHARSVLAARA